MAKRHMTMVCLVLVATMALSGCGARRTGPTSLGDFALTEGQVREIERTAQRAHQVMPMGPAPIWEVWDVATYRNMAVALVIHHFGHSIIWVRRKPSGEYIGRFSGFGSGNPGEPPSRPRPPSQHGSWSYSVEGQSSQDISPEESLHLVYGFLWCPAIATVEVSYDDGHTSGQVPVATKGYLIVRRHRTEELVAVAEVRFYDGTGRRVGSVVPVRGPAPLRGRTTH